MHAPGNDGPSRRSVITAVGAGAVATAVGAGTAAATVRGTVPMREIPRTGERIPVMGLGTFMTWDILPRHPRGRLREVLRRLWEGGGTVVDTSALYGMSEVNVGDAARALGLTDRLFLTNKTWATGEYLNHTGQADRQFAQSQRRLSRRRIDVLQVHSLANAEMNVALHQRWKREGRMRYAGVTHHVFPAYVPAMEHWMRTVPLDFVQIRYSIFMREAERTLLPLAADRGIAVQVNMPLEKGRLHHLVRGRELPGFAREFCDGWTDFFLKYVISHPAVTNVVPGTGDPDHMTQNLRAARGDLPDQATRERMVAHLRTIPGFDDLERMPWYPGRVWDKGLVRL
ncbi:MAG TPA: aldo/keto reductase [Thermomonospora sp.]|nr:aldo/keto reductase [Thermomonospora sp.]